MPDLIVCSPLQSKETRTTMSLRALFILLSLGLSGMVHAGERPAAIGAYMQTLASVEGSKTAVSLEPLMASAVAAQDALMEIQGFGDQAWIETLDDDQYQKLQNELRGFRLSRGYDVYAQPDPAFLDALAQKLGLPADRDFFRLYRGYWNKDLLPVYLDMGKRPTPCVRFGEGVLQEQYAGWSEYVRRYPDAYTGFTRQTLADLEEAVGLGVCTCTDTASVQRELGSFLKRFPKSPVAGKVRSRLVELKETPDLRPVLCR
ncbi:MAG TPA: hypothetical protein VGE22_20860 [Solimonas sp.]